MTKIEAAVKATKARNMIKGTTIGFFSAPEPPVPFIVFPPAFR
jgi:hypothetical protein